MTLTNRPAFIPLPEASAFPPDLLTLRHWVAYDLEKREQGWTKVPKDARSNGQGRNARSNDSQTWTTFAEAYAFAKRRGLGLGFMLAPPLVGFDIDDCRDPETGELSSLAASVLGEMDTYAEVSVSGTGIKGIAYGTKPGGRCRRKGLKLEMYSELRLFALTGQRLPDAPLAVNDCQGAIDFLYRAAFGEQDAAPAVEWNPAAVTSDDDQAIIEWIRNSRSGPKFDRYWAGQDDGDPSGGDQGLANYLAFRVGPDPARIEALFNLSARAGRAKWQKRAAYREGTIRKAIDSCGGRFYEARPPRLHVVAPQPQQVPPQDAEAPVDPVLAELLKLSKEELARRTVAAERAQARTSRILADVMQIRRNAAIKAERDTLVAAVLHMSAEQAGGRVTPQGRIRQPLYKIADAVGKENKTASRHLRLGPENDLFDRELLKEVMVSVRDEATGEPHTILRLVDPTTGKVVEECLPEQVFGTAGAARSNARVDTEEATGAYYVRPKHKPEEILDILVVLTPDRGDKKEWGGKREPCPVCQSQRRVKIVACADCGHEFGRKIEEPPGDTLLPEREGLPTDDVGNVAPIPVEELAQATETYPPAFVAQAQEIQPPKGDTPHARDTATRLADDDDLPDVWDEHECNAIACRKPIDGALGKRYCWEHRHLDRRNAPPDLTPGPRPIPFTLGGRAPLASPAPPEEPWYEPPAEAPPDDPTLPYGTLEETPEGLMEVIYL
jgi:hypothetical protein